ncbi:MAG: YlcI/YnfO family protein [Oscillospiraceae bacterium]
MKFKIPKTPSSTNKSIRFPNDLIEQVEDAIRGQDCTFSAFVVEAVRVALENLQDDED